MADTNDKLTTILNHLISIANDGKYGYQNAAEDVKDISLKQMFQQYSSERARYAEDLKRAVAGIDDAPDKSGGPLGALHRTWIDIKAAVTSGDREAILKTCITGEEAAIKAYTDALDNENITGNIKQLLTEQKGGVEAALNSIRSMVAVIKT